MSRQLSGAAPRGLASERACSTDKRTTPAIPRALRPRSMQAATEAIPAC